MGPSLRVIEVLMERRDIWLILVPRVFLGNLKTRGLLGPKGPPGIPRPMEDTTWLLTLRLLLL